MPAPFLYSVCKINEALISVLEYPQLRYLCSARSSIQLGSNQWRDNPRDPSQSLALNISETAACGLQRWQVGCYIRQSLNGVSGCGATAKTQHGLTSCNICTMLRDVSLCVAADMEATGLSVQERQIGFVFQSYALFNHMTVADNIGFGIRIRKLGVDKEARCGFTPCTCVRVKSSP